jgi:long-chain acyl-CoA synthetase
VLNLSVFLEDSARKHPERDALVLGDIRLTYAQVEAAANQVANLLVSLGIERGEKVALSCPNVPYFPMLYYGILKAGAVVVPLNVLLKGREIAYHLKDSDATAYFCFEGTEDLPMGTEGRIGFERADGCEHFFLVTANPFADSAVEGVPTLGQALAGRSPVFEPADTAETDTAVILYTSGTTGQPKGAELSHANLVMNALTCNRLFGTSSSEHETHLLTLPLFHSFGSTTQMNAGFSTGATLVLLPRFDAEQAVALMEKERITFFAGVPTMYWGLLGALTDDVDVDTITSTLKRAVSGGASLPVEIIRQMQQRFHLQILEGYGLSETAPVATFSDPERDPRPGSIGVPIWGVELKLVDHDWNTVEGADEVGEIAVRGHNVMKGYYNRPDATAEVMNNGWFRTGDLARRDEDGFYYIVDRAKDMIIRGGFNIYPREVEEVLYTHPEVLEAAVVAIPDDLMGEEVGAAVVLRPGATATLEDIQAYVKERIAAYKYPRKLWLLPELPKGPTGKILRREVRPSA